MQLRYARWLSLWLVAATPQWASADETTDSDVEANAGVHGSLYLDSDHTTIVTTSTEASTRFDGQWQVGVHYLLDVVSSASIDVVAQASNHFDDVRHEIGGSAGYRSDNGTSLIGSYSHSTENDWQSHNASLAGSIDLLERNLSLSLSVGVQDNTITRADTFGFERQLSAYLATLSAGYTASPRDLVHVALSLSHYDGFQASPYRYLTVRQMGYAENVPEQRDRLALVGRYHRFLGGGFSWRSHARLYTDSYAVHAITAGTELAFEKDALDITGLVRGYSQTSAEFYRRTYQDQQRYMTLDKEMSTFWDAFVGGAVGWTFRELSPLRELRIEARAAANYFHFVDFARLQSRYGLTATLGLSGNL